MSPQGFKQHSLFVKPWSSLVEGDEGLNLPNCKTNLVIDHDALSLHIVLYFHKHNSLPLGQIQAFISRKLPHPRLIIILISPITDLFLFLYFTYI